MCNQRIAIVFCCGCWQVKTVEAYTRVGIFGVRSVGDGNLLMVVLKAKKGGGRV